MKESAIESRLRQLQEQAFLLCDAPRMLEEKKRELASAQAAVPRIEALVIDTLAGVASFTKDVECLGKITEEIKLLTKKQTSCP